MAKDRYVKIGKHYFMVKSGVTSKGCVLINNSVDIIAKIDAQKWNEQTLQILETALSKCPAVIRTDLDAEGMYDIAKTAAININEHLPTTTAIETQENTEPEEEIDEETEQVQTHYEEGESFYHKGQLWNIWSIDEKEIVACPHGYLAGKPWDRKTLELETGFTFGEIVSAPVETPEATETLVEPEVRRPDEPIIEETPTLETDQACISRHQITTAASYVKDLFYDLGIEKDVVTDDYWIRIENEPYMWLGIETHGNQIYMAHYATDGAGELYIETEMVWRFNETGKLEFKECASNAGWGEIRNADYGFAEMFSRNLVQQGFGKGKIIPQRYSEPEPNPQPDQPESLLPLPPVDEPPVDEPEETPPAPENFQEEAQQVPAEPEVHEYEEPENEQRKAYRAHFSIQCDKPLYILPADGRQFVVLEVCTNESDAMTDYYMPNSPIGPALLLKETTEQARTARLLYDAINQYPELRKLKWKKHSPHYGGVELHAVPDEQPKNLIPEFRKGKSVHYVVSVERGRYSARCIPYKHYIEPPKVDTTPVSVPVESFNGDRAKPITIQFDRDWMWVIGGLTPKQVSTLYNNGFSFSRKRQAYYRKAHMDAKQLATLLEG